MTDYIIHGQTLTDIADAIRTKNPDISGLIDPSDMKANILSIPSGSGEPYFPKESLISEFDFIYDYENNKNITYDKVKDDTLVGNFLVSNMQLTANGLLNLGGRFNTGIVPDNDIPLKIVIKFGTFDRSYSLDEYNFIVNFCWDTPDSRANIIWRDEEDRYGLGGDINGNPVRYENSDPYFFENKTVIFLWNCILRNGQITQYDNGQKVKNHLSIYLEDGTILSEAPYLSYYNKDYFPSLTLGADGYQYRGAVYEDVKVYALNLEVDPSQDIIQPLNITQNGTYEANGTTIAGYSPINVNVSCSEINIVSELPSTLVDDALYLIPSDYHLVPPIPSNLGYSKICITANLDDVIPNYEKVTEFYLMAADIMQTNWTNSYTSYPLTFGGGDDIPPQKIYKYTKGGTFEWTEINVTTFWTEDKYRKATNIIYANNNIARRRVSSDIAYLTTSNIIEPNGEIYRMLRKVFNMYHVENNIAIDKGNINLDYDMNYDFIAPINIEHNGSYTADGLNYIGYSPVVVNISLDEQKCNFYDYDGTVVYSYTKSDFLELEALPTPPTHSGLTSDGWNWSLADAKAYVTNHGKIDIGAMYYWDEDYTEVDLTLVDGRLSPYLCFAINGSATVDWGDGSSTETVTGSNINTFIRTQHTYANGGDYTITITPDTGTSIALGNSNNKLLMKNATGNNGDTDRPYTHSIKKIRVGKNSILNADCFNSLQNLEFVALPKTITTLNIGTFRYCFSLESIAWHNDITSIGQNQFQTTVLKFIAFPSSATTYASSICNNDVELKNVSLNNTSTLGDSMFLNCSSLTHIYIPDSVTVTPDSFCEKCRGLTELELPIGIETFETDSFLNCDGLSGEFNFPSTLTTIGISAFNGCYGITKLKFNSSVTLYGSCFRLCDAIKEIIFESNVEFSGTNQFENCYGLNSITFNGSVTSISNSAFSNCYSIESITLPNTLISLNNYVFNNWDGLREITLPDTITTLGSYLFNSCSSLNKVTLPSNITTIPEKCFSECVNLQEVTIPSGVTSLESGAFYRTYALSNITIPSGVTDMKGECFRYCHSLGYIKFEGSTPPTLNNANCFGGLPTDCIIYVPTGSLSAYTSKQYYPSSSTYTYVEY